ncbi:MAG: ribonuclease III [Eubacterium sp.]|nr:ribonuclease III [Eubacterium sp.]
MDTRLEKPAGVSASSIRSFYGLPKQDIHSYSPLALAYIGDSIYDLTIRTMVVERGNTSANRLHYQTSRLVRAHAQSAMMAYLMPELTDEETAVYKRGRNAKSYTMAKNATVADYRRATGFEALMGWLYLTDQTERMLSLIKIGLSGYQREMQEAKGPKKQ